MANETEELFTSFLGTGWGFPPTFNRLSGQVGLTSDELDIQRSLQILLSTTPGERVMRPTYGVNLRRLLFEPLNTTLKTYVADLIRKAILLHEPRIAVDKITIEPAIGDDNEIEIGVEYTIRSTNNRANFVYPFYKEEGTNL
ncbi:MAG: GPW/gp25 family protein [Bacteroidota bacterium]